MKFLVITDGKEVEVEADSFNCEYDEAKSVIFFNILQEEYALQKNVALYRNVEKVVPIGV